MKAKEQKYKYTIVIETLTNVSDLSKILNRYAGEGYRIVSVDKLNNLIYEGNKTKYTIVLESKVKSKVKNDAERYLNEWYKI